MSSFPRRTREEKGEGVSTRRASPQPLSGLIWGLALRLLAGCGVGGGQEVEEKGQQAEHAATLIV
jgi:hypothetical protein